VFNYGHSFGHALESLSNYAIPHGIAVAYGMDIANFVSQKKGYIGSEVREEIRAVLKPIWIDFPINEISIDRFLEALSKDKKNVGTQLGLILMKGHGRVFKQLVNKDAQFEGWIEQYFEEIKR
jgi:3-dehydroquinate synthase